MGLSPSNANHAFKNASLIGVPAAGFGSGFSPVEGTKFCLPFLTRYIQLPILGFSIALRHASVFNAVYEAACQPIKDALDLAYLTGQRVSDTIAMSETDISNGKLTVVQGKTKKKLRINIVGQLEMLINKITTRKAGHKVRTLQLIYNEKGRAVTLNRLQIRFREARERAALANPSLKLEIEQFQFRDLRAKAATDIHEDTRDITAAQKLLGHTTIGMTEDYLRDRRGESVKPTK